MNATVTQAALDSDELLHLAIRAMNDGNNEQALVLLGRASALAPDDGRIHYMRGGIHASIGMIERAIDEMTRAVALNPDLGTAHLQLGLLHFSRGDFDAAKRAWTALDDLAPGDALRLFKSGLVHLGNGEFADCIALLKRGLDAGRHEALDREMRLVLKSAESALAAAQAAATEPAPAATVAAEASAGAQHVLLAGYAAMSPVRPDGAGSAG